MFRFGPYEADARARELRKRGLRIKLRDKSFEVLVALLEHPGEAVTREQLRRRLWPEGVFVDFDNSLNSAVNRLRGALGDRAGKPKYVETLPRRGYRFIGPVEHVPINRPTLAVLPFENLSLTHEQDFFADVVTDALITGLGNVSTLRVISRQSVLHLKGTQKTAPEIAREFKADAIVEGSVLQAEGRIRMTAQLIQVDPEQHLWAKAYECEVRDIVTTQGQVARAIAEAVEVALSPSELERLNRSRPIDPEAHVLYLKGQHCMEHWSREGFLKGLEYFRLALEKDPTHALACAHMAECYGLLGFWGHLPFAEAFPRAKDAARRSLALDEALSTAHWVLGWASWLLDWDLVTCETETVRAIQLNASDAGAHVHYSVFLAAVRGDYAKAAAEAKLALELAPLSQYVNTYAAWIYVFVDDYGRAIEQAHRALELFPESLQAYYALGMAELSRCRYTEAIAAFQKAVVIAPEALSIAYLGHANARAGNVDEALGSVDELLSRSTREPVPPRALVVLYAGLGDRDRASEWLRKAFEMRDPGLFWLRVNPLYDPLSSDPRFEEVLHRLGLRGVDHSTPGKLPLV
jgi:TolB-like protein